MFAFLRFVLIAIIVIYLLGFIFRLFLRFYIKRMGKRYGWNAQESEQRPEGDIKLKGTQPKSKKVDKDLGDYVDYEEVKP
jgi:hypothetical protein